MENASKALIIAGSVLLAVLILTTLVFTFNQISNLKQVEANSEEEKVLAQYNKQIESFSKPGLYGSEILSLANLVEDYNIRQADLKSYKPITLKVTTSSIVGAEILTATQYSDYKKLINDFKKIEDQFKKLKQTKICGQTLDKLAGMTTLALQDFIAKYNAANRTSYTLEEIEEQTAKYQSLNTEIQTFKNKKFDMPEVKYDEATGRVVSMTYKEIGL